MDPTLQSPVWQVHITLLDDHNSANGTRFPNGEPAVGGVVFGTDFSIAGTATPGNFGLVDWSSSTDDVLAGVSCVTLYGFLSDPGTDTSLCNPNKTSGCIGFVSHSGAACGATASSSPPFINGSGTADFTADVVPLGDCLTFRTVITIQDGFGNVADLVSDLWASGCVAKPVP